VDGEDAIDVLVWAAFAIVVLFQVRQAWQRVLGRRRK
jgi:hypothetical protein